MHYNENAGKPWIRQTFSANVSKSQFRQNILPPKFCSIRYVNNLEDEHHGGEEYGRFSYTAVSKT